MYNTTLIGRLIINFSNSNHNENRKMSINNVADTIDNGGVYLESKCIIQCSD